MSILEIIFRLLEAVILSWAVLRIIRLVDENKEAAKKVEAIRIQADQKVRDTVAAFYDEIESVRGELKRESEAQRSDTSYLRDELRQQTKGLAAEVEKLKSELDKLAKTRPAAKPKTPAKPKPKPKKKPNA